MNKKTDREEVIMSEGFTIPNEHEVNFGAYFPISMLETKYQPIYFIPCRLNENKEVEVYSETTLYFLIDAMPSHEIDEDFFTKPEHIKSLHVYSCYEQIESQWITFQQITDEQLSVTNKILLQSAMRQAGSHGYPDLIVGFLDQENKIFVQGAYISDFNKFEPFNLLDYYMYKTFRDFYLDEDLLDFKIKKISEQFKKYDFSFELSDLEDLVCRLKRSCLEGSFDTNYSDNYDEMNEEIFYIVPKYIKNEKEIASASQIYELCSFLKSLEVLEFYVKSTNGKFVQIEKINELSGGKEFEISGENIRIAFHPRLQEMLRDRYN